MESIKDFFLNTDGWGLRSKYDGEQVYIKTIGSELIMVHHIPTDKNDPHRPVLIYYRPEHSFDYFDVLDWEALHIFDLGDLQIDFMSKEYQDFIEYFVEEALRVLKVQQ
tara:strand:- start:23361 stop:23687 length:327 start_codon:yes stop_codon:yes gene_type:complete